MIVENCYERSKAVQRRHPSEVLGLWHLDRCLWVWSQGSAVGGKTSLRLDGVSGIRLEAMLVPETAPFPNNPILWMLLTSSQRRGNRLWNTTAVKRSGQHVIPDFQQSDALSALTATVWQTPSIILVFTVCFNAMHADNSYKIHKPVPAFHPPWAAPLCMFINYHLPSHNLQVQTCTFFLVYKFTSRFCSFGNSHLLKMIFVWCFKTGYILKCVEKNCCKLFIYAA